MFQLSPSRRRELKARAHHLNPIVMVGADGLTSAVLREIDLALKSHELVKLRVLGDDREERSAMLDEICSKLDAAPVQAIGKMLVVFRPKPEEPQRAPAPKPRASRKKAPRRTKRSHQMG